MGSTIFGPSWTRAAAVRKDGNGLADLVMRLADGHSSDKLSPISHQASAQLSWLPVSYYAATAWCFAIFWRGSHWSNRGVICWWPIDEWSSRAKFAEDVSSRGSSVNNSPWRKRSKRFGRLGKAIGRLVRWKSNSPLAIR